METFNYLVWWFEIGGYSKPNVTYNSVNRAGTIYYIICTTSTVAPREVVLRVPITVTNTKVGGLLINPLKANPLPVFSLSLH